MFLKHFFAQMNETGFHRSRVKYVVQTQLNYVTFQHMIALFIDFEADGNVAELLVSESYALFF